MTRPSERELEQHIDELTTSSQVGDAEAYALLVAAACGDERAADQFGQLPSEQQQQLVD